MLEASILHRVLLRTNINTVDMYTCTVPGSSEAVCNVVNQTETLYLEDLDSLSSAGLVRYKPLGDSAESAMLAILTVDVIHAYSVSMQLQLCHADG